MFSVFGVLLAIASVAADPHSLRLTLDRHAPGDGPMHVSRTTRISIAITLHRPANPPRGPMIEAERPEVDVENRSAGYFDKRPGPNVELHAVRIEGNRRVAVPIRIFYSGSGGSQDTNDVEVDIIVPPADSESKLTTMIECMTAALPKKPGLPDLTGLRAYFKPLIVDNDPGTYELTASYRATTWPKQTPAIVSSPMVFVVDDGVDGYQQFCDRLSGTKKP